MKRALVVWLALALHAAAADPPRRIVSLSPNVTEMLYGIGAFQQVVGISDYCTYPPAVKNLPSVGGWANPDLEKLAALHPDLVILDAAQAGLVKDDFNKLGLPVFTVRDGTIEDVYRTMRALGQATRHEQEAERLIATTRAGLLRVAQKTAALPGASVVVIVDRTPGTLRDLYASTEGGFLAELVQIAGGRVGLPPSRLGYTRLSKEDLLAVNPDVILEFIHGVNSRLAGDPMEAWNDMPELKAVRTKRVRGVNEDYVPHASQRMLQTAALFARLIHPEIP